MRYWFGCWCCIVSELKVCWSLLGCSLILLYFTVVGVFVGNCGSVCGVIFPLLGLCSEV